MLGFITLSTDKNDNVDFSRESMEIVFNIVYQTKVSHSPNIVKKKNNRTAHNEFFFLFALRAI